jgi:hypothetical protein
MQERDEILDELRSLSRIFDTMSRESLYEAPDRYFIDLPARILDRVRSAAATAATTAAGEEFAGPAVGSEGRQDGSPVLPGGGQSHPAFTLPEGYFDGLAARILDKIRAGSDNPAAGNSPLSLDSPLDARAELAFLSPLLNRLERKAPYQVPDGYFVDLSSFTEAVPAMAEETLTPVMAGLRNEQTFQVPEAYFESLPLVILSRVASPARSSKTSPAKVISFRFRKNGWKYAAAAVLTGFAFMLGWLRLHNSSHPGTPDIAQTLYKVSDQEIQNYLDNHSVQIAEVDMSTNNNNSLDISDNDVKLLLGDIPDGDLKQYIDEHGGGTKDLATN